jgi:hypothetical protein
MSVVPRRFRFPSRCRRLPCVALAALALLAACTRRADTRPLIEAGVSFEAVRELHRMKVTNAEVLELVRIKNAGAVEPTLLELLRIARSRDRALASAEAVVHLRNAGMSDAAVLELARLDQLDAWADEARVIRLAGFSDAVVLELARRRTAGQPVPSGPSLAQLKNAGYTESAILDLIRKGSTDADVSALLAPKPRRR